jgi:hypothetical protein
MSHSLLNRSARLSVGVLGGLLAFLLMAAPSVAQITTNTALPVSEGRGLLRVQSKIIQADAGGAQRPDLSVFGFPLVGAYGVTQDLTVFGVAPILDKNLEVTPQGRRIERGATGLGDVRLFARYTVWSRNRAGQTQRVAPLAGIETPTGDDDEADEFGRLPQPLQLGSGSWDPFFGAVFTWQTLQWQVDVSPVYEVNTEADNFEFGDEARLDVASKYRVWTHEREGKVPGFFYANLETNVIWQGKNEIGNQDDPNSGGTAWFVAPGVQYVTRKFVVEGAVQLPALQDGNGMALEDDFITTLSVRINI